MAELNSTNLRQAEAKAKAVGYVSDIDLKFYKENVEVLNEVEADSIRGYVSVKTSETNFVRYDVNISKKTKAGTDNKVYPGILTVKNEYKSIAEVGIEEADKVVVNGDFNLYQSAQTGEEIVRYKSNYFTRLKADAEMEPVAKFDVEAFIHNIVPEVNTEGEETGRLKVHCIIPVYNGVECMTLIAPEEITGAIENAYEPGMTVNFEGEIINSRIEHVTEIPMLIGKPKKKVTYENKNELVITGASEAYEEGISKENPYDSDTIKAAMEERKNKFEERKATAQQKNTTTTKSSGAAKGRTLGF